MDVSAIYATVSQWYKTGSLSQSDQPAILAAHAEVTGITFSQCRKCQWADVQHALMYHLIKVLKLPAMDKTQKYMIRKGQAYLQIHGLAYVYINKGEGSESASAKHLTDEVAVKLMKDYPELKEEKVIVENPEYGAEAKGGDEGNEKKLTPQQKAAQTKAAAKAAEAAAKEKEPAKSDPDTDPAKAADNQDSQPQE